MDTLSSTNSMVTARPTVSELTSLVMDTLNTSSDCICTGTERARRRGSINAAEALTATNAGVRGAEALNACERARTVERARRDEGSANRRGTSHAMLSASM